MSKFEGLSNLSVGFYLDSMGVVNQAAMDARDAQLVPALDIALTQTDTFSWKEYVLKTKVKWDNSKESVYEEDTVSADTRQRDKTVGRVLFNLREGIRGREVAVQTRLPESNVRTGRELVPYRAIQRQWHPGQNR